MVIVDAGHGGTDPGSSNGDIIEKDYTLKIANYMYNRFKDLGIPTFITRTEDVTLNPTDRINVITPNITSSDDIVISNHLNAGGGDGAEIVYALRNDDTLSKMILDNIEETGQNIRKWYQRKLPSNPNRDYYYIIRNTSPAESILVNDTYTVARGDSLWSIAKRFNVGVNEIKNANNLKSNLISVGQELIIPGAAPSDQTNVTYVVQTGDSLWSIANANNTTVDELANLNDLGTNTIYVGQALQIPNTGSSGTTTPDTQTTYVVQKGDTLYSIALKYGTTPNAIIRKNNLKNNTITVGQTLTIPNDVESTGDYSDMSNSNTYVVQRGDSLYSIANAYNVSVNDLRNINNLTSDILSVGQVLIIPGNLNRNSNTSNLYVVKRGDSLWSIANKFNVSINKIRMLNNLNSDILTIGQTLIIP